MKQMDWSQFDSDKDVLEYLRALPRYRNNIIKSAWWRLRFFVSLVYCRLSGVDKPLFIVFVTNNGCNLKCTYCYGDYGHRSAKGDYSTVKILEMVDEFKSLGTRLLTMHGGEALLRKDIGEVLNYAKLKGFYISFNTNGYYVERRLDEIRCVDTVVVSLDGAKDNNDKLRGKGCYDQAIKAIDILATAKIPVTVSATLTRTTEHDMSYLAELAQSMNVNVQYSMLYNSDEMAASSDGDIWMSDEEVRAATKRILGLKQRKYPIYYNEKVLDTLLKWPMNFEKKSTIFKGEQMSKSTKKKMINCYHGSLKYQIDADGRVVTCWHHDKPDAPNIKDLGVRGALKACNDNNNCIHCSFLANNEHNALMDLQLGNIISTGLIQVRDLFNMTGSKKQSVDTGIAKFSENVAVNRE